MVCAADVDIRHPPGSEAHQTWRYTSQAAYSRVSPGIGKGQRNSILCIPPGRGDCCRNRYRTARRREALLCTDVTPKPQQIGFDGWAIFDPGAAVALGERLGLIAANEGQLAGCLHIRQERNVDIVLSGDVIDLDARASGDGGAQLD